MKLFLSFVSNVSLESLQNWLEWECVLRCLAQYRILVMMRAEGEVSQSPRQLRQQSGNVHTRKALKSLIQVLNHARVDVTYVRH